MSHNQSERRRSALEIIEDIVRLKEEWKWAGRYGEPHVIVQKLQEAVNLGHELERVFFPSILDMVMDSALSKRPETPVSREKLAEWFRFMEDSSRRRRAEMEAYIEAKELKGPDADAP